MKIWHMSGAGNDFLVVDARNKSLNMENMAKKLCAQYRADGFMALDNSCIADIKLHFYNSDGSRANMCGNGARCICRFAFDNGIVEQKMCIETDAGQVFGERLSESVYKIRLNDPKNLEFDKKPGIDYVVVGVPHACVKVSESDLTNNEKLLKIARDIRFDPVFEEGANVNFYCMTDKNTVKILTYERGVEDFTLACGTGSGAVASVLWSLQEIDFDNVTLKNQGGDLRVFIESENDKIRSIYLEGDTEILEKFDFFEEEL